MQLSQDYSQDFEPRFELAFTIIVAVLALIGLRLYYLQIVKGHYYRFFSEENSIRSQPIPALRGNMLDRNGEILVQTRPSFDLVIIPQYVVDPNRVLATLETEVSLPHDFLQTRWAKRSEQPAYQPIVIAADVPADTVSWVRGHKVPWTDPNDPIDLRGVEIVVRYEREYPVGDIATHLLGYVAELDNTRLKKYQSEWPGRYHRGDRAGVYGLEEVWDRTLRGTDGTEEKVVNAAGRIVASGDFSEELVRKESVNGKHLRLTVDQKLQTVARDAFRGKKGAAVAMDPNTGEVLLLYSAPSFDLNRFTGNERKGLWQEIAEGNQNQLLNRALQGAYPPGSTYKIVTGTAALQEKKVRDNEPIFCPGYLAFGSRNFKCWKSAGHSSVSFHQALVESCDVFFYQMGIRLGVDTLADYAHAFGLGAPTGLKLTDERSGFIPTSEWKLRKRGEAWQAGETLSIAIGQGYDSVTPMQEVLMISRVATLGKIVQPHLVKALINAEDGKEIPLETPEEVFEKSSVTLDPAVLKKVRDALVGVVAEPGGTAHRLSALNIPMGGKTGTAQVVALHQNCGEGEECGDHAWFVAFAPVEDPKIAVAVLVEHGGHGSSAAAPIAGEIIQNYLQRK